MHGGFVKRNMEGEMILKFAVAWFKKEEVSRKILANLSD